MESILELPARFQESNKLAKAALRELMSHLPFKPKRTTIDSDSELLTERLQSKFMLIEDGRISCIRSNILLFIFDGGDLLGLDSLLALDDIRLRTTFAVPVLEIPKAEFFKAVESNPQLQILWTKYVSLQLDLLMIITGHVMKGEFDPGTAIKTFREGEIIIQQGDDSTDVFTLVDGRATVLFNKVQVGEIGDNEIFGVLSALGGTPRTATVMAKTICTVVVMPKEHFVEFFKSRPSAVLKMVEDMALTIVKLNQRVAKLDKPELAKP
jgi:CRP-like cAMP-binding protein